MLIKIQLEATVCSLVYFTANSLYMFRVSKHPSSGVLKTVTATSGTGHNNGTSTSLQRGSIGPRWRDLHEDLCTNIKISCSFRLRMRNVSDRIEEKVKTRILRSITLFFLSKIVLFMG